MQAIVQAVARASTKCIDGALRDRLDLVGLVEIHRAAVVRGQSHVIDCTLHAHDAQSPLLEHESPAPNEPGVHAVVAPPPAPELLAPHMQAPLMVRACLVLATAGAVAPSAGMRVSPIRVNFMAYLHQKSRSHIRRCQSP